MKNKIYILIMILCCVITISDCNRRRPKPPPTPQKADPVIVKAAWRVNKAGMDINDYNTKTKKTNFVCSPLSVYSALVSTYLASKDGDYSEKDPLAEALYKKSPDKHFGFFGELLKKIKISSSRVTRFQSGDSIWLSDKCQYNNRLLDNLGRIFTDCKQHDEKRLPFSKDPTTAAKLINEWVSLYTNDMIKEIVSPSTITQNTKAVITNAVYFKGAWESPFDSDNTFVSDFTMEGDKKVEKMFMSQLMRVSYFDSVNNFEVIEMFYKDRQFSILIFLPHKDKKLNNIFGGKSKQVNAKFFEKFRKLATEQTLSVFLPKFKQETTLHGGEMGKLQSALQKTGELRGLMDPEVNAEECGTANLDDIITKTVVEVDEKGSEASAATAIIMGRSLGRSFRVNRPFAFAIQHVATTTVLFFGKIYEPKGFEVMAETEKL